MSDPYASVAEHYDIMIDWPARLARERNFFEPLFAGGEIHRVLDIGCGTGFHSRLFADLGAEVIGVDPSRPMLERARELTHGENPLFVEGSFSSIPQFSGPFDLVTILGNTLSYVHDSRELQRTLRDICKVLAPGGRLLIQTVNYDSLLAQGSRWLPLINRKVEGREYLFLREYRVIAKYAEFTLVTLISDDEWTRSVERSIHYPITGQRLHYALLRSGFHDVTLSGDFEFAPYDPISSPSLIALAVRR
ncbi:MAG: class I SAM-dependent methyltransferase [Armatimonadota bacterium]